MIEISSRDHVIVEKILHSILSDEARVFVFGSRSFGTVKRSSDLDLAIDAGRKLTREEQQKLFDEFEESDLPYKVDIVDLNNVSESFKKIIDSTKKPFLKS